MSSVPSVFRTACMHPKLGSSRPVSLWESEEGQSDSVWQAGPRRGLGHWERGPFHTRQISFPPCPGTLKDAHQGTSLCPYGLSAHDNPQPSYSECVCTFHVHILLSPSPSSLHCLFLLPQARRSASSLTCILRDPFDISAHDWLCFYDSESNAFYSSPS